MSPNTLNLVGDGDDIDVIRDVEQTFGIKLTDREAEQCHNVGDLYALIVSKRKALDPDTQACLSQASFYRLRRALTEMGLSYPITPATPLDQAIAAINGNGKESIRATWKELGRRSHLRLPPLEIPWMRDHVGTWHLWACAFGIVACGAAVTFALHRLTGMNVAIAIFSNIIILPLGGGAVALLLQRCFGTIPRRVETLGHLAREAAGFTFRDLWREKKSYGPSDLWFALTAILRQISGRKGLIDRETTFFAR